ncbi:MAG: hypothetical protein ACJAZM_003246 [Cyclobacteriaceae bacterium]
MKNILDFYGRAYAEENNKLGLTTLDFYNSMYLKIFISSIYTGIVPEDDRLEDWRY